MIEIVPLDKPELLVSSNTTLYRFVFPAVNDKDNDNAESDEELEKFKYTWIEEQVLVNEGGVPKECSVHVEKVPINQSGKPNLKSLYLRIKIEFSHCL